MTQEDKELLLKDLSARLPYHVCLKVWLKDGTTEEGVLDLEHNYGDVLRDAFYYNKIIDIKPYLRPLSSMTDEEFVYFMSIRGMNLKSFEIQKMMSENFNHLNSVAIVNTLGRYSHNIDWLNKNMFDYRGLIPKGLAIAVTQENNPYEN